LPELLLYLLVAAPVPGFIATYFAKEAAKQLG
jgi:hypothetical protein